jgi:hypothetical protein
MDSKRLLKEDNKMTRKRWDKVADKEFDALDKAWQEDWKDLRERINRH